MSAQRAPAVPEFSSPARVGPAGGAVRDEVEHRAVELEGVAVRVDDERGVGGRSWSTRVDEPGMSPLSPRVKAWSGAQPSKMQAPSSVTPATPRPVTTRADVGHRGRSTPPISWSEARRRSRSAGRRAWRLAPAAGAVIVRHGSMRRTCWSAGRARRRPRRRGRAKGLGVARPLGAGTRCRPCPAG